jgi:DNA polymerase
MTHQQNTIPPHRLPPTTVKLPIVNDSFPTLDGLASRIRGCELCPLHLTRQNAVPGDGPANSLIVVVGEAPGALEDSRGLPFQGTAGKLLTQLLEEAGLSRSNLFITNLVKCRPPKNRDPLPEEIAACSPYLDVQLNLLDPSYVLLLGRHATRRLFPESPPISEVHGQAWTRDHRTFVPLYHPAATIYNRKLRPALIADLQRVAERIADPSSCSTS